MNNFMESYRDEVKALHLLDRSMLRRQDKQNVNTLIATMETDERGIRRKILHYEDLRDFIATLDYANLKTDSRTPSYAIDDTEDVVMTTQRAQWMATPDQIRQQGVAWSSSTPGRQFQGRCRTCGKWGHRAFECATVEIDKISRTVGTDTSMLTQDNTHSIETEHHSGSADELICIIEEFNDTPCLKTMDEEQKPQAGFITLDSASWRNIAGHAAIAQYV